MGFRLGRSAQEDPEDCRRMRFKLEAWMKAGARLSSEMCFIVRFADAAGDQVGQRRFPVDGISAGWQGRTEGVHLHSAAGDACGCLPVLPPSPSPFPLRGPPTAMGIYAVRALEAHGGRALRTRASSMKPDPAADKRTPIANGWGRSGTAPSMAKLVSTSAGEAFCILDDDPGAHRRVESRCGPGHRLVEPGETLTVEWSEMYDIGMGNRFDVNYGQLNARHLHLLER